MTLRGKLVEETEGLIVVDFYWPSELKKDEETLEEFFEAYNSSNIYVECFDGEVKCLQIDEANYDKNVEIVRIKYYL